MNREDLKRLTLLGIAGGLFLSAQAQAGYQYQESQPGRGAMAGRNGCGGKNGCSHGGETSANDRMQMQMQGKSQEENAFYSQLNPEGKRMWNNLNFEGRQLALRLSRQFSDKNQAVREAQKQMDMKAPTSPSGPQAPSNQQGMRGGRYSSLAMTEEGGMQTQDMNMDERTFYSQLSADSKKIWDSLDSEGRQLAMRLSKQYNDKNQAVREAQKQQMEMKSPMNHQKQMNPQAPSNPQGMRGWRSSPIAEGDMQTQDMNMDERTFYSQLSADTKKIWDTLDTEGRQLAMRLAKQYNDKNQAVREAQKQMNQHTPQSNPMRNQRTPSQQEGARNTY